MPFPLAHPAVVLPLRRWCPRALSFPALVVGSISPDLGYCFGALNVHEFSHRWLGIFGFCLPAGLLLLWLFYRLRLPALAILPGRYQHVLSPLCRRPAGPFPVIVLSVLIGAATHVIGDSFTHKEGWFVQRLQVLQVPVLPVAGHTVRVFHLLWYACSFAGVAWLCLAYEHWKQTGGTGAAPASRRLSVGKAVLFGSLVVFIGALHHLVTNWLGYCLVGCLSLVLVVGIALSIGNPGQGGQASEA